MKVSEIMTPGARCVGPDVNLVVAAGIMRDLNIGALPVCERDHDHDRLAGMVTDRDVTIRAVAQAWNPADTPVSAVMSAEIVYAFDDQDVEDAIRLMEMKQVRRLPVLNHNMHLVGVVSLGDVAVESMQLSGEALKEISQPGHSSPAS